jgi:uncharacterized membrane protein
MLPKIFWIRSLFYSSIYCFAFLMIRNTIEENTTYNFLIWNLFLGFIPLVIAYFLYYWLPGKSAILWCLGIFTWLVFYPNAPYMITDLIHVDPSEKDVVYDTLMIFSFSILSLFYGYYSIKLIFELLLQKMNRSRSILLIFLFILMSSFGIYLGRILRLNTWDIVTHPLQTFIEIWNHLFPVTQNPVTYAIIIIFSILQIMVLSFTMDINKIQSKDV